MQNSAVILTFEFDVSFVNRKTSDISSSNRTRLRGSGKADEAEILPLAETPVGGPISAIPNWRFLLIHPTIPLSTRFRDYGVSHVKVRTAETGFSMFECSKPSVANRHPWMNIDDGLLQPWVSFTWFARGGQTNSQYSYDSLSRYAVRQACQARAKSEILHDGNNFQERSKSNTPRSEMNRR